MNYDKYQGCKSKDRVIGRLEENSQGDICPNPNIYANYEAVRESKEVICGDANDLSVLEVFLESKHLSVVQYTALTRKRHAAHGTVQSILQEEREHLKKLELEYFLLSGVKLEFQAAIYPTGNLISCLRAAYLKEMTESLEYLKAAEETNNHVFACLYGQIANDEQKHAVMLRKCIETMI